MFRYKHVLRGNSHKSRKSLMADIGQRWCSAGHYATFDQFTSATGKYCRQHASQKGRAAADGTAYRGLSFERLMANQNNCCDVCRRRISLNGVDGVKAEQDHNHATRWVRGLVCHPCNIDIASHERYPDKFKARMEKTWRQEQYARVVQYSEKWQKIHDDWKASLPDYTQPESTDPQRYSNPEYDAWVARGRK